MYDFTSSRYRLKTLLEAKLELLRYQQGRMSTIQYFNKYLEKIYAYERCGGSIGQEEGVLKFIDEYDVSVINAKLGKKLTLPPAPNGLNFSNVETLTREQLVQGFVDIEEYVDAMNIYQTEVRRWERRKANHSDLRKQVARDTVIGYMLLHNASDSKFAELKYDINQDFLTGTNTFPDTAEGVLKLLSNFQPRKTNKYQQVRYQRDNEEVNESTATTVTEPTTAVTLFQSEGSLAGIDGKVHPSIECWNCGAKGHYRGQCPSGVTEAQHIQTVARNGDAVISEGDDGNYALSYFQDTNDFSGRKGHKYQMKRPHSGFC